MSRELWERVQGVMDGRRVKKHRRGERAFAFSRMISCGHRGCSVVGEMKKQKYVYYHCTGHKGKCGERYVREEALEKQFAQILGGLRFDDEIMSWVRDALTADLRQPLDLFAVTVATEPSFDGFTVSAR